MSKIKNGGLDQYGAGLFEQRQSGTPGVEGVKIYKKTYTNISNKVAGCNQILTSAVTYFPNKYTVFTNQCLPIRFTAPLSNRHHSAVMTVWSRE